jgi:hypothetical protein
VHRHVLVTLRDLIDEQIAELDHLDADGTSSGGPAVRRAAAKGRSYAKNSTQGPIQATLDRNARRRLKRQRARAAEGRSYADASMPNETPKVSDWPELRLALRAKIQALGTTYRAVAAAAGCKQGTLRSWLSTRASKPPSVHSQEQLRNWLVADPPPPRLPKSRRLLS